MIDAVLVHPGTAVGEIGELWRDRPRRLGARKLHPHALVVAHELDAGELCGLRIEPLVEALGNEMCVHVDDELVHGKHSPYVEVIGNWITAYSDSSCPRLSHGCPV